jgi:hypothetical protein
LGHINES